MSKVTLILTCCMKTFNKYLKILYIILWFYWQCSWTRVVFSTSEVSRKIENLINFFEKEVILELFSHEKGRGKKKVKITRFIYLVFIREIRKVILSSPCVCVSFHPLSIPSLSEVYKDTSQSTAPGMTRPVLWNKLECATYTRRLYNWPYTHLPGEGEFFI